LERLKSNKGITISALIITVIILMTIAGTAVYTGRDVYQDSKVEAFVQELQIIQNVVNNEYSKIENGDLSYVSYGEDIDTFDDGSIAKGYKKFTPAKLKENLNLNGVTQTVYINFLTKDVISVNGINVNGEMKYSLRDFDNYNIILNNTNTIKDLYINTTNTTTEINTHNNYINSITNNV